MLTYKQINTLSGWLVFAISTLVYVLTVEQTASFWDPGEFVAVSYKLQVPHPPGAPLFLLIGRMFSLLALGDVSRVAFWVNMMSVVSSALTILFLHWTIVLIGRKILNKTFDSLTKSESIILLLSGFIGALVYTFSDSFWFNAVEAEVYAMATFILSLLFWRGLRWEQEMNTPQLIERCRGWLGVRAVQDHPG